MINKVMDVYMFYHDISMYRIGLFTAKLTIYSFPISPVNSINYVYCEGDAGYARLILDTDYLCSGSVTRCYVLLHYKLSYLAI